MGGSDYGTVFDIQRYSIHDGPGIRTVVFLKGCPLSCHWCHNPEGQSVQPQVLRFADRCTGCGACVAVCPDPAACVGCGRCVAVCLQGARRLAGRRLSVADVLREVERDTVFFDESGGGVTFSGGEPLAQPAFLAALLRECRRRELRTAVETSGYADAADVVAVAADVDLWLYDIKLVDPARHRAATGVGSERIIANLTTLAAGGAAIIVRVPLIPGVNDDDANLDAIGALVAGLPAPTTAPAAVGRLSPTGRELHLLPYHTAGSAKYARLGRAYTLDDTPHPGPLTLERCAARLRTHGLNVTIGGAEQ